MYESPLAPQGESLFILHPALTGEPRSGSGCPASCAQHAGGGWLHRHSSPYSGLTGLCKLTTGQYDSPEREKRGSGRKRVHIPSKPSQHQGGETEAEGYCPLCCAQPCFPWSLSNPRAYSSVVGESFPLSQTWCARREAWPRTGVQGRYLLFQYPEQVFQLLTNTIFLPLVANCT